MTTPSSPEEQFRPKMTLVAISDTHGRHGEMKHQIPPGDVLIHAGDFTGRGLQSDAERFAKWFESQPHKHKIVIPGNHDAIVEAAPRQIKDAFLECGIHLLIHEELVIDGWRFFGSPYTPEFCDWHFMKRRGSELRKLWDQIAPDVDVVITHGPAYGHGDLAPSYKGSLPRHVGCMDLLRRIAFIEPQYHIFGHIHDGYGITASDEADHTAFVNASTCNESYHPRNAPILLALKDPVGTTLETELL